ncbi:MAG: EF-hand domain-containing protein [Pseudomonadota bacterium]|nr:EF-hand domain-containing protein [Pseudomonadota bacterium]
MNAARLLLNTTFLALTCALPALAQQPEPPATPASTPAKASKGEQQALKWFKLLDTNKDGRISRAEAKIAFRLSPRVADQFRNTDLNGDGYLTEQEIRTTAERRRAERQERREREAAAANSAADGTQTQ